MAIATQIGTDIGGYAGVANHYRLSEPLDGNDLVVVFAVDHPGAMNDETVIVGAREDGSAHLMNRLPGSLVGWADHEKALMLAGYEVVAPEPEPEAEAVKSDADGEDGAPGRDGADGGVVG